MNNGKIEERKKVLERLSIGIAVMFGIYWIYNIFIQGRLDLSVQLKSILGAVSLYVVGLIVFLFAIKKYPSEKAKKGKVGTKTLFRCLSLHFTAFLIFFAINIIMSIIMTASGMKMNSMLDNVNVLAPDMLFTLLIFNPIVEELVFRKAFANKLLKYGESFFILASAFCFSILHSVSAGIPNVFNTFILGLVWAYLYVKTGSLVLPIIMHAISNLIGGIIPMGLQSVSMGYFAIYMLFVLIMGIVGIVMFVKNKKEIVLDGEKKFITKEEVKEMLSNKGIIIYIVVTAFMLIAENVIK